MQADSFSSGNSHNSGTFQVAQQTVSVLLPIPTGRPYTYAAPQGVELQPGDIVQVPLGPRLVAGVVWDDPADAVDARKLRPVEQKFDCPPLNAEMRDFIKWVADYCIASPGMVLRMVLRTPAAFDPPAPMAGLRFSGIEPERMTGPREAVLELARSGMAWTKSGLAHAAGVSATVVDGLAKAGSFEAVDIAVPPVVAPPEPGHDSPVLSSGQQDAADALRECVTGGGFSATLLEGVTGSGKTEVYFEAVAAALEAGRQVLILLPEIALTPSFLERFEARFGSRPAEWHSELAARKREQVWRQAATGQVRVVAGARSALFLPFCEPGLIVVDEEHDPAYKQEDRVFYNARDMAVVRAHGAGIPVILASATPSLETQANAKSGKYRHVQLPGRYGDALLPDISVIDMRRDAPPAGRFISPRLAAAVGETLASGRQSLLFLNRRGYAPLTLCRVCGHRFECKNCSSWLVEHRFRQQLQCHHCGYNEPVPEACPNCGTLDHLAACGPGVERLAEEVSALFPDARIIVLSSDMLGSVSRLRLELEAIAKGEADIVIGTQLVAKGHNFPLMALVGVVDADLGLANGDPRAAERTFQLLSQVTGRAGRSGEASRGILQTYQPQHPVIQALAAGDSEAFYQRESDHRRLAGLPPFGKLASIIISAASRKEAEDHARQVRKLAPAGNGILVLGPAEAPMALIRGRYRFRLLVHGEKRSDMQAYLRAWLSAAPRERGSVRLQVDVDPQSFL
ncbi:MAG: primosomal protein N' [Nitratireductor sp.]|nr:primosomal protein N' [Nitratireductor sp.]MCB1456321.1 primosomal protein N' [Nitratireductor sp.]